MNLIQTLEQEEIARLNKTIPAYAPGDTVIVSVNVVEGTRKRMQAFEGVVIAKRNRGLNSSFIVRKISNGEGVERTFQVSKELGFDGAWEQHRSSMRVSLCHLACCADGDRLWRNRMIELVARILG